MQFQMSPNIAIHASDPDKAIEFYTKVLGFPNNSSDPGTADIDANPLRMFVMKAEPAIGVVMELFVDDLDEAKTILLENGCKVIRWEGKGKDCYIEDPFGLKFNIWQK